MLYLLGDRPAAVAAAERCMAIIDAHAIGGRAPALAVLLYAAGVERPDRPALDALQREAALESARTWHYMLSGCTVALLYGDAGAPEQGLQVLRGLSHAEKLGFHAPEVQRAEGELRRRMSPGTPDEAERCFRRALDLARRRELKSMELRAAISLARLWHDQGRRADAHRVLGDVYGWFSEGFDTHDLRLARTLLDELEP